MHTEVKIPKLPASAGHAEISNIYVAEGQQVNADDILFDVETDKVVLEVPATKAGIIDDFKIAQGDRVTSEQVVMLLTAQEGSKTTASTDSAVADDDVKAINEQKLKEEFTRAVSEQVDGNLLLDKRGIICGVIGLVIGFALGVLSVVVSQG